MDDVVGLGVTPSVFSYALEASRCYFNDCASLVVRIGTCRLQSTTEIIKKFLDVISLASIAVVIGVGVWLAVWGEAPRPAGHLSIQSKIIAWDVVPGAFGINWLIFRYAKVAVERFPRVFGRRGLLFYFAFVLIGSLLFVRLFSFVCGVILPKLVGG
jgi:hypothetical protein